MGNPLIDDYLGALREDRDKLRTALAQIADHLRSQRKKDAWIDFSYRRAIDTLKESYKEMGDGAD